MKKVARIFSLIIATAILFILFDIALMLWQLTPVSAVSQYENVKSLRWHRKDLVEHFPKTIPSRAQDPQFYYRAGFLQGGASIELRLHMPAEFVEEVYETYMAKATSIFNGAEKLPNGAHNPDILPKWHFFTFPTDQNETPGAEPLLPQDFEILLLSSHPYKSNPTDWNHGESSGISISKKRREIIYWAEDW
jgi:hypothetical protein